MAEKFLSAYPYQLDYLCSFGESASRFHEKLVIPLSWFGFGSVKDLLDLPVTLLNRYVFLMEEEGMLERFYSFKDPYFKSKGR